MQQFIKNMEELNMIPFGGWNGRDFESFLSTDNENLQVAKSERERVKEKLTQFLNEVKDEIIQKDEILKDCNLHIGNLDREHVWGAIKFNNGDLINQIHVSIIMSATNFSIGIQIEGNKPTKIVIEKIKSNKDVFLSIINKLNDFNYVVRKRYQIQASKWDSDVVAQIVLGEEVTTNDVEYLIKKMEQYKYVELRIAKIYDQHIVINKGKEFLDECVDAIASVSEMVKFLR